MAQIDQDKIDNIVFLWGRIDFNFDYYSKSWYHLADGRYSREEKETKQDHKRNTELIDELRADVARGTFSSKDVNLLKNIAQDLCHWNLRYPLEMNFGAFSEWLLVARHAKISEKADEFEIIEKEDWERLRAYYLKVKDLQLQSSEDADEDWTYLAKYCEENSK